MSRQRYLRVRNFDALQHYKERNPTWIKLYCSILEDYDFAILPDETKFHAVGLMLLASRLNNKFPADEVWLRAKINAEKEINLEMLLEIRFLEAISSEKGEKTDESSGAKRATNACKSKKTKDDLASTTFKNEKSRASTEQSREEERRTHTQQKRDETLARSEEEIAVSVDSENSSQNNGHLSRFSLEECFKYVEICKSNGENITNPKGLATSLFENGKADAFILATLYPEENEKREIEIYGEPRQFSEEPCAVCFGSKMEVVKDKGARPCPNCKNEKGHATGKQPEGEEDDEQENFD
jgi:hypothetical protein